MSVNSVTFVAPNLAWGKARGASARAPRSIPRQWGCDRRATKPQAKLGATPRAAVLCDPGGVARSLQIHWRDMLVARALPGPQNPRRKRHRIYAHDHLEERCAILRFQFGQALLDGLHVFRQLKDRFVNLVLGLLVGEGGHGGMDAHQFTREIIAGIADLLNGGRLVHNLCRSPVFYP